MPRNICFLSQKSMITQSLTITQVIFNNYQGIGKCYFPDVALGIYMVQLTLDDGVRPGRVETGVGSSGNTTRIEGIQILGFVGCDARVGERLEAVMSGKNTLRNFWGTE